tara:strand:+ start:125061 stop:125453 length:393 start_codon:yes stop_codon:yes gene_type:complete
MFQKFRKVKCDPAQLAGIVLSISILLSVNTAHATESINGHRFISLCVVVDSDYQSKQRFAECESFVGGVREVLGNQTIHGHRACIPESVPDIQLLVAGIVRMKSVPEQHDGEAHVILAEFFAQRWPCNDR